MLAQYSQRLGGFGVGVCRCGHLQSDHSNLPIPLHDQDGHVRLEHHQGGCCAGTCSCKRYTFQRWATLDEVADIFITRRTTCVA